MSPLPAVREARTVKRIQRKRTKGWRMPEGAIYVGRPTRWGNPYNVTANNSAKYAVARYRLDVERGLNSWTPSYRRAFLDSLRGHDLVCWCPLDQPCHADVLLELASSQQSEKP